MLSLVQRNHALVNLVGSPLMLLFCYVSDQFLTCKEIPQLCTFRKMCKNCTMAISDIKITLPANLEDMIPSYIPGFVIEVSD